MLSPLEVDAHKPRQIAILLDYDVVSSSPVPTRYARDDPRATRDPANVGRPGYCDHGNLAVQCRECRTERLASPPPDDAPDGGGPSDGATPPRSRLRRVV